MKDGFLPGGKRTLVVLFIPSVERDGRTTVDQGRWVKAALKMFGDVYGGATAYPKATGVWRDDEREGALVFDEPVVVHCYMTPKDAQTKTKLKKLATFCRRMGRESIKERSVSSSPMSTTRYVISRSQSHEEQTQTERQRKIADALGAERRGKVSAHSGYFGAMQIVAEIQGRLRVPARGGRPRIRNGPSAAWFLLRRRR